MEKNILNNRGLTFIEAIIAVAVLIFVSVALLTLYNSYTKVYNYQETVMRVAGSARTTANELQNTALQSNQIVASHTFSGHEYSTDESTVVLEIPSVDGSGNIVSGKHDYAVFYTIGTDLYKLVQADAASSRPSGLKQLSDSIAAITFIYNNADLAQADKIDADMQMQATSRRQTVTYNLRESIYLRNK